MSMPWEKTFDRERTLGRATRLFWRRGYEATSIQDLVSGLGINRGSLYATFGGKRSLFLEALLHYDDEHRRAFTDRHRQRRSARKAITGAFEEVIETSTRGGSRDGCLLVNTALELAPHDGQVAAIVDRALRDVETFFADMIERGQNQNEIPGSVRRTDTARALLSLFIGLRVLSRSRPDRAVFRSIVRQAEAMLS
jgi:TetR/AcrR family transcriptional repressor of nem operon